MTSSTTSISVVEPHPVRLGVPDDPARSRLTVAVRLVLAIPHLVFIVLWGLTIPPVAVVTWAATLVTGRPPDALQRFLARYVRYTTQVTAYVALLSDPFPPFGGRHGAYAAELELDSPSEQNRWGVAFRLLLAVPALVILNALQAVLQAVAVLGWFYALATGRMHPGLRGIGAYCLRYQAQTYAYVTLLTSRYPSLSGVA